MREAGIARRYVRALHGVAMESGVTLAKAVLADLHWFDSLLIEDPHLKTYLADPRISNLEKKKTLEKALPDDLQDLSRDFFLWMVERGRAGLAQWVAAEYESLLRDEQGLALAEVTSASRLDPEDRADLAERLETITSRKIKMVTKVDASLLGGVMVRIGSMLFDGTLRRQLDDLRTGLRSAPLPTPESYEFSALEHDDGADEEQP